MRKGTKRIQGTWRRFVALSLVVLPSFSGCAHFDAKAFVTTNPLYYSDLIPGNAKDWERVVWANTHKPYRNIACAKPALAVTQPKTKALNAFSDKGLYNKPNHLVLYPIGEIDILMHEYFHARNATLDQRCISEVWAIYATNDWVNKRKQVLTYNYLYFSPARRN